MATHIRIRRDTSSGWNTSNPVLMQAEFGLETDTFHLKIGDGVNPWLNLPYCLLEEFTQEEKAKLSSVGFGADVSPPRVSPIEKAAATLTDLRGFSPSDIKDMILALAPDAGGDSETIIDGGTPASTFSVIVEGGTP